MLNNQHTSCHFSIASRAERADLLNQRQGSELCATTST